jgi:hypothetical protein
MALAVPVQISALIAAPAAIGLEMKASVAAAADARCKAGLTDRDIERAKRFCDETHAEATNLLATTPEDKTTVKTRARAERRLADIERVHGNT